MPLLAFLLFWLATAVAFHYYNIWRDYAVTILNCYSFYRVEYCETIFSSLRLEILLCSFLFLLEHGTLLCTCTLLQVTSYDSFVLFIQSQVGLTLFTIHLFFMQLHVIIQFHAGLHILCVVYASAPLPLFSQSSH
jgi:hypothetical protein